MSKNTASKTSKHFLAKTENGLVEGNEVKFTSQEVATQYDCDHTEVYRIYCIHHPTRVTPQDDYVTLVRLNGDRVGFANPLKLRLVELAEFQAYEDAETEPVVLAMFGAGRKPVHFYLEEGTVTKVPEQATRMPRSEARDLAFRLNDSRLLDIAYRWYPMSEDAVAEPTEVTTGDTYVSLGKGRLVKLGNVEKGVALLAIATVMVRKEVCAAEAMSDAHDAERTGIMMQAGIDGEDAENLLDVDIDHLTDD